MDTNGLENLDKEERFKIRDAIVLLQKYGYNISPPQITNENDEYSFERFWDEYDKKCGPKDKIKKKWGKLPLSVRKEIFEYIPKYKLSQPEKCYRKHPYTFLNQRGWEDEIIIHNDRKLTKQEAMRDIAFKAAANQANMSSAMDGEVYNPFATDDGV